MTFVKGQSGNPGGRPEAEKAVLALARSNGLEAMKVLLGHMRHEDPKIGMIAANSVLDRAFGKPTQMLANDPDNPFEGGKQLSADEVADQLVAALAKAEAARK